MQTLTKENILERIKQERRGFFSIYATMVLIGFLIMKRAGRSVALAHGQTGKLICYGIVIFLFMVLPLIVYFVSLNTSALIKRGSFYITKDMVSKKHHFVGERTDYALSFAKHKKGKERYKVLEEEYESVEEGDEFFLICAGPFQKIAAYFPVSEWELSVDLQQKYKEY